MDPIRAIRYARHYRNWWELERVRASGRVPHSAVLRGGPRFDAPEDTNVLRLIRGVFFQKYYTPPGFEIGPDDVVVDVGANVGTFSVYAGLRTRGRVLAVEPVPGNLEFLERNLRQNGCSHVEVFGGALADKDGSIRLEVMDNGVRHRLSDLGPTSAPGHTIEVPSRTLATLMEERGIDHIDYLKLDCEGAEGLILPSLRGHWAERIRRIGLEFHDRLSPLGHEALEGLLAEMGFRTRLSWDGADVRGFLYASR